MSHHLNVRVDYFTDPLCAWSYASEPTIQSLISEYRDKVDFEFHSLPILDRIVGGPKPGEKFHTPEEMQQEWEEIARKTGTRINASLWQQNPPHSSWPGNRAMKAAFRQGFDKGNRFTSLLRNAALVESKNTSNFEVLMQVARDAGLDTDMFRTDMTDNSPQLEKEVADDKFKAVDNCIESTPTLLMHNDNGDRVVISGTLDYDLCSRAIRFLRGEKVIGAPEVEVQPSI